MEFREFIKSKTLKKNLNNCRSCQKIILKFTKGYNDMFFVKRVLNSIINRFLNYFFYKNPRYGLRILFYLKLDIYLYL